MKRIDNSPAAFPVTPTDRSGQYGPIEYGMSLRDYFAGQALVGLLSGGGYDKWACVAEDSYNIADAMISEKWKEARDD